LLQINEVPAAGSAVVMVVEPPAQIAVTPEVITGAVIAP
jgi:hypothetical protein